MKDLLIVVTPLTTRGGTICRLNLWLKNIPSTIRVYLLYNSNEPDEVEKALKRGISSNKTIYYIHSRMLGRAGRITVIPAVIKVLHVLLRTKPDAIISIFVWADLITALAGRFLKLVGIADIRHATHIAGDPVPPQWHNTPLDKFYKIITKIGLTYTDAVLVISDKLAQSLRSRLKISKAIAFTILPISVPQQTLKKKRCDFDENPIIFGVVSRLTKKKGVDIFLQAVAVLKRAGRNFKVLIYGEGRYSDVLRQQVDQLEIAEDVKFEGWVQDPLEAMKKIDCLVLTSYSEGTPRSILEAASVGVPSIASNVGGVADIVEEGVTGWIVPPGQVEPVVSVMNYLLNNSEAILDAGVNAYYKVRNEFSISREIEELLRAVDLTR